MDRLSLVEYQKSLTILYALKKLDLRIRPPKNATETFNAPHGTWDHGNRAIDCVVKEKKPEKLLASEKMKWEKLKY